MPEPAGTGLSRRSLLLRSAGLGLAVYGAGRLAKLPLFEEGVAAGADRRAAGTVLLSVFLDGGVDGRQRARPVGDPHYLKLRPKLGLRRAGSRLPRTRGSPGIRPPPGWPTLHGEGKVCVLPAVGYTGADQSHFTSRHFWEVGALDRAPAHRLARTRAGPRSARRDNPLQGVSLGRPTRSVAGHRGEPGRGGRQARGRRLLDARRLGPRRGSRRARVHAASALAAGGSPDPARRAGRRAPRRSRAACATRWRRWARTASRPTRRPPPTRSTRTRSRRGWPASPRCSPRACRSAPPPIARAGRLRHARQPGRRAAEEPQAHVRLAAGLPARPGGARARRPRAHAGLVGVRAPRGRERLRHRPWRGRRRLPRRHARRGPDDRRVPRARQARQRRQPARDRGLPRRLRRAAAATGSASTRRRSFPMPAASASLWC